MGGVDVGSEGGKKKATNAEINMVPFIDLLMCTIAFLLITAVWVTNSRINADAQVPGPPSPDPLTVIPPEKVLNVHIGESDFALVWKQGATVVSEVRIPKSSQQVGELVQYPDLEKKLAAEWQANANHRDPSDKKLDQAILHTDNRTPFREIVAVLDALYATKRTVKHEGGDKELPVFNMTFAAR
ncbi:ExbD/TolR family protein [Polyangium jinanense]|uniref:Biopolymer transporter ExbD n=1 Tax=Polyangium jinanense TaxID=2829994 RepID=A0A9X4ATI4_9BACT|nr:biopolymer transporter ExbD [Polyangium jinanense]MDC3958033.1 biopolymer transporter ExbD [Polyangium jinanense]MDC3983586.1 biopolymer transporter ExbD [Polyangium jinanense]